MGRLSSGFPTRTPLGDSMTGGGGGGGGGATGGLTAVPLIAMRGTSVLCSPHAELSSFCLLESAMLHPLAAPVSSSPLVVLLKLVFPPPPVTSNTTAYVVFAAQRGRCRAGRGEREVLPSAPDVSRTRVVVSAWRLLHPGLPLVEERPVVMLTRCKPEAWGQC